MSKSRGRAPIGQRLVAKVPHGHWKTTTLIAALGIEGVRCSAVLDGPVNELRTRGIDVDYRHLKYLATKGEFAPESGGGAKGANYMWSKDDIDKVAEYLAGQGKLTPQAQMCLVLNLDYGQFEMTLSEAKENYFPGLEIPDLSELKMIVHPKDQYESRVEFQLPDQKGTR